MTGDNKVPRNRRYRIYVRGDSYAGTYRGTRPSLEEAIKVMDREILTNKGALSGYIERVDRVYDSLRRDSGT